MTRKIFIILYLLILATVGCDKDTMPPDIVQIDIRKISTDNGWEVQGTILNPNKSVIENISFQVTKDQYGEIRPDIAYKYSWTSIRFQTNDNSSKKEFAYNLGQFDLEEGTKYATRILVKTTDHTYSSPIIKFTHTDQVPLLELASTEVSWNDTLIIKANNIYEILKGTEPVSIINPNDLSKVTKLKPTIIEEDYFGITIPESINHEKLKIVIETKPGFIELTPSVLLKSPVIENLNNQIAFADDTIKISGKFFHPTESFAKLVPVNPSAFSQNHQIKRLPGSSNQLSFIFPFDFRTEDFSIEIFSFEDTFLNTVSTATISNKNIILEEKETIFGTYNEPLTLNGKNFTSLPFQIFIKNKKADFNIINDSQLEVFIPEPTLSDSLYFEINNIKRSTLQIKSKTLQAEILTPFIWPGQTIELKIPSFNLSTEEIYQFELRRIDDPDKSYLLEMTTTDNITLKGTVPNDFSISAATLHYYYKSINKFSDPIAELYIYEPIITDIQPLNAQYGEIITITGDFLYHPSLLTLVTQSDHNKMRLVSVNQNEVKFSINTCIQPGTSLLNLLFYRTGALIPLPDVTVSPINVTPDPIQDTNLYAPGETVTIHFNNFDATWLNDCKTYFKVSNVYTNNFKVISDKSIELVLPEVIAAEKAQIELFWNGNSYLNFLNIFIQSPWKTISIHETPFYIYRYHHHDGTELRRFYSKVITDGGSYQIINEWEKHNMLTGESQLISSHKDYYTFLDYNNSVYIQNGKEINTVDLTTGNIDSLTSMPTEKIHNTKANSKSLFVFGSPITTVDYGTDLHIFDLSTKTWSFLPSFFPASPYKHEVNINDNEIIYSDYNQFLYRYNLSNFQLTQIPLERSFNFSYAKKESILIGNHIYLINYNSLKRRDDLYIVNIETGKSLILPNIPYSKGFVQRSWNIFEYNGKVGLHMVFRNEEKSYSGYFYFESDILP